VVDAADGSPIAGAIVIGLYELTAPYGMEGGIIAGHMHVEEVVTGPDGNYHLAAWGPKPRPGKAYLDRDGPLLLVYKDGYKIFTNHSSYMPDKRYSQVQTSFYTGKTIELEKFTGDIKSYIRELSGVEIVLESLLNPYFGARACPWQQVPRMMVALDRFSQQLAASNITSIMIPDLNSLAAEGNCGTREDFIRRYENEIMDDNPGGTD
jgi:hypothetical protein